MTVEDLIMIHDDIVLRYGGGAPDVRYPESLHYAVDRPFPSFSDRDQYPDPFVKAAVLAESLIRGHPFTDGNKRTGYLSGITLLELLTDLTVEAEDDEVVEACLAVEARRMTAEQLASWMRDRADPVVNMWGENDADPFRRR